MLELKVNHEGSEKLNSSGTFKVNFNSSINNSIRRKSTRRKG